MAWQKAQIVTALSSAGIQPLASAVSQDPNQLTIATCGWVNRARGCHVAGHLSGRAFVEVKATCTLHDELCITTCPWTARMANTNCLTYVVCCRMRQTRLVPGRGGRLPGSFSQHSGGRAVCSVPCSADGRQLTTGACPPMSRSLHSCAQCICM